MKTKMNNFEYEASNYSDSTSDSRKASVYSSSPNSDASDPAPSFLRCKEERLSDDSDNEDEQGTDNESDDSTDSQQSEGDEFLRMDRPKSGGGMMRLDELQNESASPPRNVNNKKRKKKHSLEEKNDEDVKPLKIQRNAATYSRKAENMMKSMGYKKGEGLGKHGQGRVAPVEQLMQKGRRGLGLVIAEVDRSLIKYDPSIEIKSVHEHVKWLAGKVDYDISPSMLNSWMKVGPKKRILDDETHFTDPQVLKNVLICKSAFDKMTGEEMRQARTRANPYELIKKGPYMNRAAMKMANLDHVFDHMFTKPVDERERSLVAEDDLLYFADVCAGPGGFSEYILSRKGWRAKGFGFTLKGDNDFKLSDFSAGPCESFEPFYGKHDDGDVYKSDNIESFHQHVLMETDNRGVHFMMADGGFSVEGAENIQEILSKQIYLCQTLVALLIVRPGGHFVCKLFDLFTPFSVGIVYLLHLCFKQISIHKPVTSRPANSERYIVCKWKREDVDLVCDYLFRVNKQFSEASNSEVSEIVSLDMMKNDAEFYAFIVESNNSLGLLQINSLGKILEFSEDLSLKEEKQNELKNECMDLWGVDASRVHNRMQEDPEVVVRKMLSNNLQFLRKPPQKLDKHVMEKCLYTVHDYHAVILGNTPKDVNFFVCTAHKKCSKYDKSSGKWIRLSDVDVGRDVSLQLSPNTLIYGEIVKEVIGQSLSQRTVRALHIIDGHTLGNENISDLHYTERLRKCALFAKSLTRRSMNSVMRIRVKEAVELDQLHRTLSNLRIITLKNQRERLVVPIESIGNDVYHFIPTGIMLIRGTKEPYRRFVSKSFNKKYYWRPKEDPLFDVVPQKACMNFRESAESLLIWHLNEEENVPFNKQSFLHQLISFVHANIHEKRNEK